MPFLLLIATLVHAAGKGPNVDTTINIKRYGASGSVVQTTGTITAGSKMLVLGAAIDFARGDGIEVDHAGAPCIINSIACSSVIPGTPLVIPQGVVGPIPYSYKLVDVTTGGGMTAAGLAGGNVHGSEVLDGANFNHLTWIPTKDSAGKIVCRQKGGVGAFVPIVLTADSGTFDDTNFQDASGYYSPNQVPDFFSDGGAPYVPIWALGACSGPRVADNLVTTIGRVAGTKSLILANRASASVSGARVNHSEDAALAAAEKAATQQGRASTVYFPSGSYNFFRPASFITSATSSQNFDVTLISYAVGDGFQFDGLSQFTNLFVVKPSFLNANIGLASNTGSMLLSHVYEMGGLTGLDDHGLMFSGMITLSFFVGNQSGLSVNPYNLVLTGDEFYAVPDGTDRGAPWAFKNGVLCTGPAPDGEWVSATNVDIEYLTHNGVGFNGCGKSGGLSVEMSGDLYAGDFDSTATNVVAGGPTTIINQPVSKQRKALANDGNYLVTVDGNPVPLTLAQLKHVLPCNAVNEGRRASVKDLVPGGADAHYPAYCDGKNWIDLLK